MIVVTTNESQSSDNEGRNTEGAGGHKDNATGQNITQESKVVTSATERVQYDD